MIGVPRSGTTLISEILSLHGDLGWFSNYLNRFPNIPQISIFNRIMDIELFGSYLTGKKNQTGGVAGSVQRFLPHTDESYIIWKKCCGEKFLHDYLTRGKATAKEKQLICKAVQNVLRYHNKRRFFTKLTGPSRTSYLNSIFPDSVYIHILRDPRAVIASLSRVPFWRKGGGLVQPWWKNGLQNQDISIWKSHNHSPIALAALQWQRIINVYFHEKQMIGPMRFCEIRYEDFILKPNYITRKILNFLNLSYSQRIRNYLSDMAKLENMNEKYKKQLNPADIKLIETITSETADKVGYAFAK